MSAEQIAIPIDMQDFGREIAMLQHRAGELGLFRTRHRLHDASRTFGVEAADILDQATPRAILKEPNQ